MAEAWILTVSQLNEYVRRTLAGDPMLTRVTLRGEVSGRGVRVDMTGGRLIIDVEDDEGRVENLYLTGPTNIVCKGELTDEELVL